MSADGAADLRRRAAPSARTRHGGEAIDAAEKFRLRAKPAPRDRAVIASVPYFYKQGSALRTETDTLLDGKKWNNIPPPVLI